MYWKYILGMRAYGTLLTANRSHDAMGVLFLAKSCLPYAALLTFYCTNEQLVDKKEYCCSKDCGSNLHNHLSLCSIPHALCVTVCAYGCLYVALWAMMRT